MNTTLHAASTLRATLLVSQRFDFLRAKPGHAQNRTMGQCCYGNGLLCKVSCPTCFTAINERINEWLLLPIPVDSKIAIIDNAKNRCTIFIIHAVQSYGSGTGSYTTKKFFTNRNSSNSTKPSLTCH